jgi:hypothetical protein
MNKAVIVLISSLLFLSTVGCDRSSDIVSASKNVNKEDTYSAVLYEEGSYDKTHWESSGYMSGDCIPDKNTAIRIAVVILENFQNDVQFKNVVVQKVFFDTQDKIWIVSFWEDGMIGGDFEIAMRADNAQVIRMIAGE